MGLTKREMLVCCLAWVAVICIVGVYWMQETTGYWPADWDCYRNAVHRWWDPYHLPTALQFYNPPWALPMLAPFVMLPMPIGMGLLMTASLVVYTLLARHYKLPLGSTALFLLSAPVVTGLMWGQIDWLVLLGLLMPPWLGLFFVLIKPQVGMGIALYWLWQTGQEKQAIRTFAPVTAAFLLSFLAYGFWPLNWLSAPMETPFSPLLPMVAMLLMALAVHKRDIRYAVAASPWFSPHTYTHSWAGALLVVMSHSRGLALVAWGLSWVAHMLWYRGHGCTVIQCTVR